MTNKEKTDLESTLTDEEIDKIDLSGVSARLLIDRIQKAFAESFYDDDAWVKINTQGRQIALSGLLRAVQDSLSQE